MIDASRLLKQFLGAGDGAGGYHRPPAPSTPGGLEGIVGAARQVLGQAGGAGGFAGGAVAGGLLGLLLGGKKMSKGLGGVLSHGGAAMLGAMAHRAYQNWQEGQTPSAATVAATPQDAAAVEPRFLPAADGQAFELVLVRAMIAAAKADGHIDTAEQRRIFQHVEEQGLDAEAKAFVFDALSGPVGVTEIAAAARTPEQSAELYLASRLAIDPDQPAERAYLDALAHRLSLPPGLAAHLDRQVEAILPLAAGDEDLARPSPPQ